MKVCSKCGIRKGESEYAWSIKGVKKHSSCNACRAKSQADYYRRTKPQQLKYKYKRQAENREEARHYVFSYLSNRPCVDCGETDPYVLTFDHVRGSKKMNISQMFNQGYSLKALRQEIGKCEVRCANCRMRKEKERRGTLYF